MNYLSFILQILCLRLATTNRKSGDEGDMNGSKHTTTSLNNHRHIIATMSKNHHNKASKEDGMPAHRIILSEADLSRNTPYFFWQPDPAPSPSSALARNTPTVRIMMEIDSSQPIRMSPWRAIDWPCRAEGDTLPSP
ncbi:uncharacterized protein BO80DRAFT_287071 [Aspergillus ibericus CBS 121593]|uniref:Secreted protein n=1 Tax=Aspergillus ibericus CBS 121593 TaxID=1448316 RepID=A0A395H6K6_9EURO|nr:hypothetical protein BO80DRAFT_287071 [Aspergillus ibericus CBS 121593]RAL03561.1 hypothetical protein BO80DRAFT_287071 [Aspergillus ibericus CBS 121593]